MQSINWHPSFSSGPLQESPEINFYHLFVLKAKKTFFKNSQFSETTYLAVGFFDLKYFISKILL